MKSAVYLFGVLLLLAIVSGKSATDKHFSVKNDILESIRHLIGDANREIVSLPNDQVLVQIKDIIEEEINKFRFVGQKPQYSIDSCASIAELQQCSLSGFYFVDT